MSRFYCLRRIRIRWKLHPSNTTKYPVKAIPGCFILNPFHYFTEYNNHARGEAATMPPFGRNELYHTTCCLLIEADEAVLDLSLDDLRKKINSFLKALQLVALQFDLKPSGILIKIEQCKINPYDYEYDKEVVNHFSFNHYVYTSVSWNQHLYIADQVLLKNMNFNFFEGKMLRAVSLHLNGSHKEAILQFAIVAESSIKTSISDHYKSLQIEENFIENPNYRFIIHKQKGGEIQGFKDPVLEYMLKRAGFSELLHEVLLYVYRISIKLEDGELYRRLIKLYTTRNKLVHQDHIPESAQNQCLTIDYDGAVEGMHTILDLLKCWFTLDRFEVFRNRFDGTLFHFDSERFWEKPISPEESEE